MVSGCLLLLGVLVLGSSAATNCNPYPHARASSCSSSDRDHDAYKDFNNDLKYAGTREHVPDFVVNTTLSMYQFLHPCASKAEAALVLYFNGHPPDANSDWWADMSRVLQYNGPTASALIHHAAGPIGRRRKRATHYTSEYELLKADLINLLKVSGTAGDCILYLLNAYKGAAAQTFKAKYPQFHVPLPPTTPTTTTTTTTTTPIPTTARPTTPKPTTQKPTTQKPTTPKPTTTRSTTPTTTAASQISCSVCSGLSCLLSQSLTPCPPPQNLCLTVIEDTNQGRHITRKCSSDSECHQFTRHEDTAQCSQVDQVILNAGTSCHFCCHGDNCNHPPQVRPDASSLYHH